MRCIDARVGALATLLLMPFAISGATAQEKMAQERMAQEKPTQDKAVQDKAQQDQIASGRAFALKVCWVCHVVAKDQTELPVLSKPAPSFLDIAQRPDLTAEALRKFLSTHNETMGKGGQMPNPRLVDYQIDEVVAYIVSLRSK